MPEYYIVMDSITPNRALRAHFSSARASAEIALKNSGVSDKVIAAMPIFEFPMKSTDANNPLPLRVSRS
jgi:hypothetical protein